MGFWEYGLKILFSKVLDLQYTHKYYGSHIFSAWSKML